ncbi:MAG: OsmC family peroxiredoxin [Promethearchaeota archaeon]|nr:MAG: OsmC family peroxiredoxin [Candidatus Lokiarchaeota archaeon]
MSEEVKTKAKIRLEKDMIFRCDLGEIGKSIGSMGEMALKDCYIDETNQSEADMWGPNPSRLLGMALLGCLSASFIFCLKKRNFSTDNLVAEAEVIIGRNEKGFLRVKTINVNIDVKIEDAETRKRADQCRKMFEQYCTVTAAVREGIKVNVDLKY